jgi:anti-anti-sigma factor
MRRATLSRTSERPDAGTNNVASSFGGKTELRPLLAAFHTRGGTNSVRKTIPQLGRDSRMEISDRLAGGVTIVDLAGRIDSTTARSVGDKLTSLIHSGRTRIVIDLARVSYISSAGFRVLLVAARLAEGRNATLALCRLSAEVRKLFEVAEFVDLFEIHQSRPEGSIP